MGISSQCVVNLNGSGGLQHEYSSAHISSFFFFFYSSALNTNSQSSRSATTKWNYTGMNQPFRLDELTRRNSSRETQQGGSVRAAARLMTARLRRWMFNTVGGGGGKWYYSKQVMRQKPSQIKKKRKFPWSKSVGLNRRSVPAVQIPPSHLGSFQLVAASPRGFGVRQCVCNLQTQSRICLCKSMWRLERGSEIFSHVPSSASPIYGTPAGAIWLPACQRPWSHTVAWGVSSKGFHKNMRLRSVATHHIYM